MKENATHAQIDEASFRISRKRGYARLSPLKNAGRVVFSRSGNAAVPGLHFPELKCRPAVTGEYSGYSDIDVRQICLIRLLRLVKSRTICTGEEKHEKAHMQLRATYRKSKDADTAGEPAIWELEQVLEIADWCRKKHEMRTALANALPRMLEFMKQPGMPCRNDGAEQAIQARAAKERRSRRRLRSASGMRHLSTTHCPDMRAPRNLASASAGSLLRLPETRPVRVAGRRAAPRRGRREREPPDRRQRLARCRLAHMPRRRKRHHPPPMPSRPRAGAGAGPPRRLGEAFGHSRAMDVSLHQALV